MIPWSHRIKATINKGNWYSYYQKWNETEDRKCCNYGFIWEEIIQMKTNLININP